MTATDAFEFIAGYHDKSGEYPTRAYVSPATAHWLSVFGVVDPDTMQFGQNQLGVGEWYVDTALADDAIRLEPVA